MTNKVRPTQVKNTTPVAAPLITPSPAAVQQAAAVAQGAVPEPFGVRPFNPGERYNINDFVTFQGHIYRCKIASAVSAFVPANWTQIA